MTIPYEFEKCIVCQQEPPGDPEHVIPRMIGGRLAARLLCNGCNHTFGSQFVSDLKTDTSVRLAVEAISDRVPAIAARYSEGSEYLARDLDGGEIRFTKRGDTLKLIPGKSSERSIALDNDEAQNALGKKLERKGYGPDTIRRYEELFAAAARDELVPIPTGDVFVKRSASEFVPRLLPTSIKPQLWTLMALEYSALIIGDAVFRTSFDPIREHILGIRDTFEGDVRGLAAGNEYGPFHTLRLKPDSRKLAVEIRLFRWITTIVEFSWIEFEGPHPVYFEDLENSSSFYALDAEQAENNEWILVP